MRPLGRTLRLSFRVGLEGGGGELPEGVYKGESRGDPKGHIGCYLVVCWARAVSSDRDLTRLCEERAAILVVYR